MSEVNWKSKYESLKAKYLDDLDMAFRLGHEQGQQEAMMDSMAQQQQQQADEMAAQSGMQGDGQDPNQDPNAGPEMEGQEPAVSANPQGSELDKHINELESMLQKSESLDPKDLSNLLVNLKKAKYKMAQEIELKKSHQAISGIAKAMHKPKFKIGQQANHNLTNSAKRAVGMQQEIVENIMKSWEEEKTKAGKDILSQLKVEGILKE